MHYDRIKLGRVKVDDMLLGRFEVQRSELAKYIHIWWFTAMADAHLLIATKKKSGRFLLLTN